MNEWLVQGIGFAGMVLCIGCYQFKDTRKLLLMQLAGNSLYIVQFCMLGAYSGCATLVLSVLSNLILCLERKDRRAWEGLKWILIAGTLCVGMLTWDTPVSVLPGIAVVVGILTNWSRNGRIIRLGKLFCVAPGWMVYDWYARSWGGVLTELFGICSTLLSIYRHGWKSLGQSTREPV